MLPNNEVRVSQTRVVSNVVARDITDEFTRAAEKLHVGQLVKDEYFTLFEAVGALEIMDSKMDSGYLAPGENHAKALEDDYDVMRELLPEEVVGIMDQLLCHEMAWHMGHPLSQTLFTSIYLDKLLWPVPKTLEEARFYRGPRDNEDDPPLVHLVLRAYCLALVKACDFVLTRVMSEYYYEEEDFVAQLYNRSLLSEFSTEHIQKVVHRALSWLDAQEGKIDAGLRQALRDRLVFRREFLAALEQDTNVSQTRSTGHFSSSLSQVSSIEKSLSLGKPVPDAISIKIQRRLASTVPPRPLVTISPEDALAHLRRFCQDAIDIQQILDYRGPHNLRVAVWALASRKPQPSVYIRSLLQTFIVNDNKVLGSIPVKQFFYDDLAELVLPCSLLLQPENDDVEMPSNPRFQIAKHMDNFLKRVAQPLMDTFRSACLNRCRVRRTLCHTIVDWDNLQIEAEDLDVQLRTLTQEPPLSLNGGEPTFSYPLSSWAYHEKLRQLRMIIQLGFELSIYSPEELPGMYWYLSHLCSTHLGHIDRIRTFTIAASRRNVSPASFPGKKENAAAERKRAFEKTLKLLDRHTTTVLAIDAFALALHALYVLLARHNLLPTATSSQAYSSARLRYELRMKPFIPITLPQLVPFEDYQREAILEGDSDAAVLDRATRAIAEARRAWESVLANGAFLPSFDKEQESKATATATATAIEDEWRRDVKDTLRACIGTSIAIGTVKKALAERSSSKKDSQGSPLNLTVEIPEVGSKNRWHDWWVVPCVLEKKADPKK
ncbi:Mak10 subunit, NatC N-terminal acetyltransferase-domain-containing protein [Thermoascus aurantiacus ATCC 26904]